MREKGIFRIVVLALLLPLLLGVAAADAKKKKKPKSPPVTVVSATKSTSADGELATVTATCPAGKIAVGGGFTSPLLVSGTTLTDLYIVYESRRIGDNSWQVSGGREHSGGAAPSVPLTATVDCRSTTLSTKKPKKASAAKKKKRKVLRITEVSATGAPAATAQQSSCHGHLPGRHPGDRRGLLLDARSEPDGLNSFPVFFADYQSSPTSWLSGFTESGSSLTRRDQLRLLRRGPGSEGDDLSFTRPRIKHGGDPIEDSALAQLPQGTRPARWRIQLDSTGRRGPAADLDEVRRLPGRAGRSPCTTSRRSRTASPRSTTAPKASAARCGYSARR